MDEHCRRELCFNCDEKFIRNHQCKVKELLLMEGNWPNEDEEKNIKENDHNHVVETTMGHLEIMLHDFN